MTRATRYVSLRECYGLLYCGGIVRSPLISSSALCMSMALRKGNFSTQRKIRIAELQSWRLSQSASG